MSSIFAVDMYLWYKMYQVVECIHSTVFLSHNCRMYTFYSTNCRVYTCCYSTIECIHSASLPIECIHFTTFYTLWATTHIYSLKYTKISEFNLPVFIYRLFHEDFSSTFGINTVAILNHQHALYTAIWCVEEGEGGGGGGPNR